MNGRRRIDVAEASALIAEHMPLWPAVTVPVKEATGRTLREALHAERDQPPFDRVTMDGIAISLAGLETPEHRYAVQGTQGAGAPAMTLAGPGHCIEIMTGASLPTGADTVVPVERIAVADGQAVLEPDYAPQPGQFIHRQGSDHRMASCLLAPGCVVGATEMAVLTVCGCTEIRASKLPRIAVVSTGDELVEIGEPISDFQIRSSNGPALLSALLRRGHVGPTHAQLPDDPDTLLTRIKALHADHDVLIMTGGVSMGKFDHVPMILEELGVTLIFHRILQRPGLPMWFGVSHAGKPIFALPGNPVSSLVCMARYVLPALEHAAGQTNSSPLNIELAEAFDFKPDLTCFMPVSLCSRANGATQALARPTNTSGDFIALAGTDGFVELPRGRSRYEAGFVATFFPW